MEHPLKDLDQKEITANHSMKIPTKIQMNREIIALAGPGILAIVSFGIIESINLIYMGHSGDASYVAGVGIGNSFINVFAIIVLCGLNSTLGTLVS